MTYEQAKSLKEQLEPDYQQRHREFKILRDFWHGRHWEHVDGGEQSHIANLFKDLRGSRKDVGPDVRLVHNLIQEVSVKYQTFLSPLPMIRVPSDTESNLARNQANIRERYLYGCWGENKMNLVLNKMAWYLPLMGDCFLGIFPDFDRSMPRAMVRSPERAFPIRDTEGGLGAVIFSWEVPESVAKRDYPNWNPREKKRGGFWGRKGSTKSEPTVEVLEWSDREEFHRWVDGQEVNGRIHNFGFNLFDQVPFIQVPDEAWNHGAVEQAVNLNLAEDALRSLLFQSVLQNVFPILHLNDPSKFPEAIDLGPGGVVASNPGGGIEYITPPVQALPVQMGFLQSMEQAIKQQTSMPDVNFGQVNASIITGKAINELQGAGTGSTVEMVQGLGLGAALSEWNAKAIIMAQRMFKDDKILLEGFYRDSYYDLNPRSFTFNRKGSQVVGSPRNEVVFSPYLNAHEKLVMNLQAMGGGLISKQHAREQIGIPDSIAMEDEIISERFAEIVISAIEQEVIQGGGQGDLAADAEARALAYLQGQTNFAPGNPPAPALPSQAAGGEGGGGGFPVGPLAPGASGQQFAPALSLPPGSPVPPSAQGGGAAPPPGITPGSVPLDEVVQALNTLRNVAGRIFLIGEIVQTGSAADDIEVAITNPADRQTIADGAPQYAGLFHFVSVEEEPAEPFIEVTPGQEPVQGGSEVDLGIED